MGAETAKWSGAKANVQAARQKVVVSKKGERPLTRLVVGEKRVVMVGEGTVPVEPCAVLLCIVERLG